MATSSTCAALPSWLRYTTRRRHCEGIRDGATFTRLGPEPKGGWGIASPVRQTPSSAMCSPIVVAGGSKVAGPSTGPGIVTVPGSCDATAGRAIRRH
jgi:hypothetical protein